MTAAQHRPLPADALRARGAPRVRPLLGRSPERRAGDRFRVGMGPTLLKWTSPRSGTNYRLNAFPIGGYCQMKGEDGKSTEAEQQREFRQRRGLRPRQLPGQDAAAAAGDRRSPGPIANFIVALVLLFGARAGLRHRRARRRRPRSISSCPTSGREGAGCSRATGSSRSTGAPIADGNELVETIHGSRGKRLHVVYERDGAPPRGRRDAGPLASAQRQDARPPRLRAAPAARTASASAKPGSSALVAVHRRHRARRSARWQALVTHPQTVAGQVAGPDRDGARVGAGAAVRRRHVFVSLAAHDLDLARHLQPAADPGARRRPRRSSSWSRCCAGGRSTRKKKRSCTSAGSRC